MMCEGGQKSSGQRMIAVFFGGLVLIVAFVKRYHRKMAAMLVAIFPFVVALRQKIAKLRPKLKIVLTYFQMCVSGSLQNGHTTV